MNNASQIGNFLSAATLLGLGAVLWIKVHPAEWRLPVGVSSFR